MGRLFLLDNFDSFTWNLAAAFASFGIEVEVKRADDRRDRLHESASRADFIVISPGPGTPEAAQAASRIIDVATAAGKPLLGVCLGHQCIALKFGARVVGSPEPRHGKTSVIGHDGRGIYTNLLMDLPVMRYHSLAVDPSSLGEQLAQTAWTNEDEPAIMGIRHASKPIEGCQFHPESFQSRSGNAMLLNFIERRR